MMVKTIFFSILYALYSFLKNDINLYLEQDTSYGSDSNIRNLLGSKSPSAVGSLSSMAVSEEILNTFTAELAHTAYLSISRLNSGVYIDSILSNAELIHRMNLLDEQANKTRSSKASSLKIQKKCIFNKTYKLD